MRILGLDLGTKTLGVSVSDVTEVIATSITTLRFDENDYDSVIEPLKKIIDEYSVTLIILGYPKNMNNTLGDAALRSVRFKELLENSFDVEVILQDERLSSVAANNVLIKADISRKKRKEKVDSVASTIILQNYLDIRKGMKNE